MFDRTSQIWTLLAEAPALCKVALFFISWGLMWLPIAVPLAIALHWRPPQPLTVQQKLPLVCSLYLLAPLILWGFAWAEGMPFAGYGLTEPLNLLISVSQGLVGGVLGLLILFGLQARLGWVSWQPENWVKLPTVALPTLLLGLWIGAIEELIFRGFLLNQLSDLTVFRAWPWAAGAALTSLIFALLHLVWEGAENIPQLPGLWLMGMVLCWARWVDHGSLGLAWGLHTGWIWTIASLDTAQLLTYPQSAPAWLTGRQQPLAGLLGLLFMVATGLLLGLTVPP